MKGKFKMIKKSELLLRIIDLESVSSKYEDEIDALKKKVKKLEKVAKEKDVKKTTKKVNKKG